MYTILLSVLLGTVIGLSLSFGLDFGPFWSVFLGLLAAMAGYGLAAWRLRRALTSQMTGIQQIMLNGQKQLQQKINVLQSRPTGNPKQMMQELEKMQRSLIQQALDATKLMEPFMPWIPLMSRQIATMRMQFHYQMQDFDKVDELLPRCLMLEPVSIAMKLAQMHRRKQPVADIRKAFDRSMLRLKYNQGALPYSLMAWILVQDNREDEAHKLLIDACKQTENETIKKNRDRLANQHAKEFSNAGLGDEWYMLYLEQPKVSTRRQQPRFDGRPF